MKRGGSTGNKRAYAHDWYVSRPVIRFTSSGEERWFGCIEEAAEKVGVFDFSYRFWGLKSIRKSDMDSLCKAIKIVTRHSAHLLIDTSIMQTLIQPKFCIFRADKSI